MQAWLVISLCICTSSCASSRSRYYLYLDIQTPNDFAEYSFLKNTLTKRFYHDVMPPKDAKRIIKSDDHDQTAPRTCTVCPDLSVCKLGITMVSSSLWRHFSTVRLTYANFRVILQQKK